MKIFSTRSAAIAACAALLIASITTQASADGTGERPAPGNAANKGHGNIAVTGNNNNTAGNDLVIGDNNISGTGHSNLGFAYDFTITNSSSLEFTYRSDAQDCAGCTLAGATPPEHFPPGVNAVGFFKATIPTNGASATLQYIGPDELEYFITIDYNLPSGFGGVSCPDPLNYLTPYITCTVVSDSEIQFTDGPA
ncbi:hypothetical protein [Streptomyces osmaniensis]|uniref:Uncharacterized protein n=1 Tax=Streptomyces osmaniensis TaxID=593134 RepID=A0ABP6Z173_9ACTN|nr:hypothetical protein KJK32_46305 [Streptomyces sp. JCM17656]